MSSRVAFGLLYRTLIRSVRTRGRLVSLAALVLLAFVSALVAGAADDMSSLEAGARTAVVILSQLVAVGSLVVASAVLGDLYDNGSIVYVALRPVSSRALAAAAWAASCTVVLPAALVSALAVGIVHSGDGLLVASLGGALLAVAAYSALFGFLGVLVRRALPAGLAFLVLWEGFVSLAGNAGAALSVTGYVRSLLAGVTGYGLKGGPFAIGTAVVVPIAFTVLAVLATAWLLDHRELP
ncbi:MAG: hypothetical protein KDB02_05425 [Acidimicrobiales bacterium]|nr:hypothetical protein [Acidimicrobiales bacterium]